MTALPVSVVQRLPQYYRWSPGLEGAAVEAYSRNETGDESELIGLRLLSHSGTSAWAVMSALKAALAEIQVDSRVAEWEGEPCLFVHQRDEPATSCRLKNQGVAIAETFSPASIC